MTPDHAGLLLLTPRRAHADALTLVLEARVRPVTATTSNAAAVSHATGNTPVVMLVDYATQDLVAGLRSLRRVAPNTPIVVYGVDCEDGAGERIIGAAQAGASSFLDAAQPLTQCIDAIDLAVAGESYCSPLVARVLLRALHLVASVPEGHHVEVRAEGSVLSTRERLVAELLVSGLTNRQIATRLVVTEATVKSHVHAILRKLGVARREQVETRLGRISTAALGQRPPPPTG